MKILLTFFGIILALLIAIYALLFSNMGNSILKPHVENFIKTKTGYDLKFEKFDINFSDFDIHAVVNKEISLLANGKYSILNKSIDAQYDLSAKNLESFGVKLDEPMNVKGTIFGSFKPKHGIIAIYGNGKAFDSNLNFKANLKNFKPLDLQIDAKGLNVAKILAVLKQPIYANGNIDIISDIKSPNGSLGNGNANIKSSNLVLNHKVLQTLGVEIPANTKVSLNSDINVENSIATAKTTINSNLANLSVQKSIYDMQNGILTSDFNLIVPNLATIEKLIHYKTNGDLSATGNVKTDMKNLEISNSKIKAFNSAITANVDGKYALTTKNGDFNAVFNIADFAKLSHITKQKLNGSAKGDAKISLKNGGLNTIALNLTGLGGKLDISGNLKDLNVKANNLSLALLTSFIGMQTFADGVINANAKLNLEKNINGNADFSVNNGVLYKNYISNLTKKQAINDVKFSTTATTNIKNSLANFKANFKSDLMNIPSLSGSYNINNGVLDAVYELIIDDLKKLKFLTSTELKGNFKCDGKAQKNGDKLNLTFHSNTIGGVMDGKLAGDNLNVNVKNFIVKELTDMLQISHFYDGVGDLAFSYNTKNSSGKFDATINQGRLAPSGFVNVASKILGKDLAAQVYNNTKVVGTIVKNLITFDANMAAQKSKLNVSKGTLNTQNNAINIPIKANLEKTDLDVVIAGTTNNPKYSVHSDYLKQKLGDGLSKGIDKLFGNKNQNTNSDAQEKKSNKEKASEALKGLIKGLF